MRGPRHSKGQIAIILAMVLPVVAGAVAVGVDFAVMYFNWVQLQKASDAAALVGSRYLPSDPTGALATRAANLYVGKKDLAGNDKVSIKTDYSGTDPAITVILTRGVPYAFGQSLGLTRANVSVTSTALAKAMAGSNSNYRCVLSQK